jgi:hypothetical protein
MLAGGMSFARLTCVYYLIMVVVLTSDNWCTVNWLPCASAVKTV